MARPQKKLRQPKKSSTQTPQQHQHKVPESLSLSPTPVSPSNVRASNAASTSTSASTMPRHDGSSLQPASSAPSETSATFPFFRLPLELRDKIYAYASLTEPTWIGSPPLLDNESNVIIEKKSMNKGSILIRTEHSLIIACREVRDEFRAAVWRDYMTTELQVDLRVHDFSHQPIADLFFKSCSRIEHQKLVEAWKCRIRIHLTRGFQRSSVSHSDLRVVIESALFVWASFCNDNGLIAQHCVEKFEWLDVNMLDRVMKRCIFYWERGDEMLLLKEEGEKAVFAHIALLVSEARLESNAARLAKRTAFHHLAPLASGSAVKPKGRTDVQSSEEVWIGFQPPKQQLALSTEKACWDMT